jgi:hypothetical protein
MGLKPNVPILQCSITPTVLSRKILQEEKLSSFIRSVAWLPLRRTARIASWHAQKRITGLPNNYAWGQASWNREQMQFTTKPTS